MNNKETPEEIFHRHSQPAAKFCCKEPEKVKELEIRLIQGDYIKREEAERLFPKALERIKRFIGSDNPEEYWTLGVIKDYWFREHSRIIDSEGDGHKQFIDKERETCKVSLVEILEIGKKEDNIWPVKVRYKDKEIDSKSYIKLEKGDKVTFHKGEICYKPSEEDIKKYFK